MGCLYFLNMHLINAVGYGETFPLDGEGAQEWSLWKTI